MPCRQLNNRLIFKNKVSPIVHSEHLNSPFKLCKNAVVCKLDLDLFCILGDANATPIFPVRTK